MRDDRGAIRPLLCILVLAMTIYAATKFVGPYYRYYALRSEVKELARLDYTRPERLRRAIYKKVQELHIPLSYDDIEVSITEGTISVYTSWSERVEFPGGYGVTLNFEVDVEE